jgi:hypothetical protein
VGVKALAPAKRAVHVLLRHDRPRISASKMQESADKTPIMQVHLYLLKLLKPKHQMEKYKNTPCLSE